MTRPQSSSRNERDGSSGNYILVPRAHCFSDPEAPRHDKTFSRAKARWLRKTMGSGDENGTRER